MKVIKSVLLSCSASLLFLAACSPKEEIAPGDLDLPEDELIVATIDNDEDYHFKDSVREEWEEEEEEEEFVKHLPFSTESFIEKYNHVSEELLIEDEELNDGHVLFKLNTDEEYKTKFKTAKADELLDFYSIMGTFDYDENLMVSLGITHYHSKPFKNENVLDGFFERSMDIVKVVTNSDQNALNIINEEFKKIKNKKIPNNVKKNPVKEQIFIYDSFVFYFNMNEDDVSFSVMPKSEYHPSTTRKGINLKNETSL